MEGMAIFEKRLRRLLKVETKIIPDIKNAKNLPVAELKKREGQLILERIGSGDVLILLDERGKMLTSIQFAGWMQQKMNQGVGKIVFQVGGAYGFSPAVYARANGKIALSAMTFSHQMIRLLLVEQLYRAMAILNHLPYHNE